jgi:hypothetical protein
VSIQRAAMACPLRVLGVPRTGASSPKEGKNMENRVGDEVPSEAEAEKLVKDIEAIGKRTTTAGYTALVPAMGADPELENEMKPALEALGGRSQAEATRAKAGVMSRSRGRPGAGAARPLRRAK